MKITTQTTKRAANLGNKGFTLIEMIGVLAVIAILAAVLVPKVFEAINNSRVNNTAMSLNSVKTAVADHYAKYGSLLSSNGVALVVADEGATNYSKTLVAEGFMDKPFACKISGDVTTMVEAVATVTAATAVTAINSAYDLDGNGPTVNDSPGSAMIQARIEAVTLNDARDLNDRLDGATLGTTSGADLLGRVKYGAGVGGITTVYVYLTHR